MRTLSRPMFNMGGPIKQGIMQGIREPYRGGQLVRPGPGRQGYAGEAAAINAAKWLATIGSRGQQFSKVGQTIGGIGSKISAASPGWLKAAWSRDPLVKGAGWTKRALTSPVAKTRATKAVQSLFTPTGLAGTAGVGYIGSKFLPGKKEELPEATEPGTFPGSGKKIVSGDTSTEASRADFAKKQRTQRVNKYLDLMGYDRSKKTAIADALIDASQIVGGKKI